ncbi:MAG: TPM domain-containing protein [Gemmatimonadetes bacterium]|nr:TPM domain-containing protein [Gemmatimonadota bacterium]
MFAARRLERRRLHRARLTPETFLSAGEEERVVAAIRSFEERTSGEIRVHLDHRAAGDLLAAAHARFGELGLERTRDRNGILFYVAVGQRRFAVVGDVGIDRATADDFWAGIVRAVEERFRAGDHVGGLALGIERAGAELATHFPHRTDDVNELSDEISRSEGGD